MWLEALVSTTIRAEKTGVHLTHNKLQIWKDIVRVIHKVAMEISTTFPETVTSDAPSVFQAENTAAIDACRLYKFVMDVPFSLCVCLAGLAGNTLTCVVMWSERRTSPTSFLLIVLALADNAMLLVSGFLKATITWYRYFQHDSLYLLSEYLRLYGWAVSSCVKIIANWSMVMVAVTRYVAVCLPHKSGRWLAPTKLRVATAVIIATCAVVSIPRFLIQYLVWDEASGRMRRLRTSFGESDFYLYFYVPVYYWLLPFVIPILILIASTYKLIRHLAAASKKRKEMVRSAQDQYDVTFSLVVIIIVFIICHFAAPIRRIWTEVVPRPNTYCPFSLSYFNSVANTTPVINSAFNFVSYVVFSKRFRSRVLRLLVRRSTVSPTSLDGTTPEETSGQAAGGSSRK